MKDRLSLKLKLINIYETEEISYEEIMELHQRAD